MLKSPSKVKIAQFVAKLRAPDEAGVGEGDRSDREYLPQEHLDVCPVFVGGNRDAVHAAPGEGHHFRRAGRMNLPASGNTPRRPRVRKNETAVHTGRILGVRVRDSHRPWTEVQRAVLYPAACRRDSRPNPSRCFLLVERSRGPFLKRPTLAPATSSALRRRRSSCASSCRPRRTISDSVCPVVFFNSSRATRSSLPRRA